MDLRSRSTRHCSPPASSMSWKSAVAVRTISVQGSWDQCGELVHDKFGDGAISYKDRYIEITHEHIYHCFFGHICWQPKNHNSCLITAGFAPWFSRGTPRLYCHAKRLAFRDGPAWGERPTLENRWPYLNAFNPSIWFLKLLMVRQSIFPFPRSDTQKLSER